ncbi:MAG: dihydropteroate synthase [Xanthomonadales bacterium]|nr:dihydropteroate synthase [Xanthomonadales bacterium]
MTDFDPRVTVLDCAGRPLVLDRPRVMGIVNVTPDSFSDGGRHADAAAAIAHGLALVAEGADLLDVGGESTRPGAEAVPVEEELRRVLPVVEGLAAAGTVPVSIDTSRPEVMRAAVAAGAGMINDVRALRGEGALDAAAALGVPVCLMHMQGEPDSMQEAPHYDDVIAQVHRFLAERVFACEMAGIDRRRIVLDPGFGFGKTLEHNLALLSGLDRFSDLKLPILAGLSRKRMIGTLTGQDDPAQRLHGSVAAAVLAAERGARILRVHDVAATVQALAVQTALAAAAADLPRRTAAAAPAIRWPDED